MIKLSILKHAWPFMLFLSLGVMLAIIVQQQGRQLYGSDVSLNGYSVTFTEEILQTGNFPYWNPYINGGMPHLTGLSSTMFFPSNLLMFLFNVPVQQVFLYNCVLAIIFLGFFMYIFIDYLGCSKITACLSGVFFCLSGSFISYINPGHDVMMLAMVCLPASFYFLTKGSRENNLLFYLLAGCILGVQTFSLMYQITCYSAVCLTAYFLFLFFSGKKNALHIFYFVLTLVFVLLSSSILLLPSIGYLKNSFRSGVNYEFFSSWSLHPLETIVYIYPKFFGFLESTYWGRSQFWLHNDYLGILPLIFVFAGLYFANKNKTMWFFFSMAACILILSFGGFTPLHKLLFKIPIINGFRNSSRWLGFFSFSLVIVASFGVEYILNYCRVKITPERNIKMKKYFLSLLITGGAALLVYVIFASNRDSMTSSIKNLQQFSGRFQPASRDYVSQIIYLMIREDMLLLWIHIFAGLVLVYMTVKGWFGKGLFLFACILFVILDNGLLFLQEHIYEVGGNRYKLQCIKTEPIGQEDPRRIEISKALQTDNSLFRVMPSGELNSKNWFMSDHIQSCGGYHNAPLVNFMGMNEAGMFSDIKYLSLFNAKYIISMDMINHPYLRLVYNGGVKIFQNLLNLPRAFLSSQTVKVADSEIAKKFKEPGLIPSETLLLNEEVTQPLDMVKYKGDEVKITDFKANQVKLEAESRGNSMLFLSEVYYPEWKAYVDGKETKIYKAFGLFRAIYLPKGKHNIEFKWDPKIFYIGALISLVTFVFVLGYFIYLFLKKTHKDPLSVQTSSNLKRS